MVVGLVEGGADAARVDALFHGLADRTRRDIVRRVLAAEESVTSLATHYPMSFAAVQKHVAVLERAGVVHKRRRGREQLVTGDPDRLRELSALLDRYADLWRHRIQAMDAVLASSEPIPDPIPDPDRKDR